MNPRVGFNAGVQCRRPLCLLAGAVGFRVMRHRLVSPAREIGHTRCSFGAEVRIPCFSCRTWGSRNLSPLRVRRKATGATFQKLAWRFGITDRPRKLRDMPDIAPTTWRTRVKWAVSRSGPKRYNGNGSFSSSEVKMLIGVRRNGVLEFRPILDASHRGA